jgi:hypothetical protein
MDFMLKTFGAEACGRVGAVLEQLGFVGPEAGEVDARIPGNRSVLYHRADATVETMLVFWYGGEEYVDTVITWKADGPDGERRVSAGHITAHTGYQMRRALDRHAQALPELLARKGRPD